MNYLNRRAYWYCLALMVFAADQTAKSWIHLTSPLGWSREVAPFFNLIHVLPPKSTRRSVRGRISGYAAPTPPMIA